MHTRPPSLSMPSPRRTLRRPKRRARSFRLTSCAGSSFRTAQVIRDRLVRSHHGIADGTNRVGLVGALWRIAKDDVGQLAAGFADCLVLRVGGGVWSVKGEPTLDLRLCNHG